MEEARPPIKTGDTRPPMLREMLSVPQARPRSAAENQMLRSFAQAGKPTDETRPRIAQRQAK